jgi:hypothetical protein
VLKIMVLEITKASSKWHLRALARKSKQEFLMKDFRLAALSVKVM